MRNLACLLAVLFGMSFCTAQNHDVVELSSNKCPDGKRKFYNIVRRGVLLHIKCKHYMGGNLFILLENKSSEKGRLLNTEALEEGRPTMWVRSVGPDFFVVEVKNKPYAYKFNFATNAWVKLSRLETGQSSGQRE